MGLWDQKLDTRNQHFRCGKCSGTDFYVGVQTMAQGRTNTFTKNVEVPMCKVCDIPMTRTLTKNAKARTALLVLVPLAAFIALCIWFTISMIG
jgi:predicted metal-binding protein